jgi:hypothetical protein
MTIKKVYKRLSDCMCTFLATSLEELITRDPPGQAHGDVGAEAKHFQGNCEESHCRRTSDTNLIL